MKMKRNIESGMRKLAGESGWLPGGESWLASMRRNLHVAKAKAKPGQLSKYQPGEAAAQWRRSVAK